MRTKGIDVNWRVSVSFLSHTIVNSHQVRLEQADTPRESLDIEFPVDGVCCHESELLLYEVELGMEEVHGACVQTWLVVETWEQPGAAVGCVSRRVRVVTRWGRK